MGIAMQGTCMKIDNNNSLFPVKNQQHPTNHDAGFESILFEKNNSSTIPNRSDLIDDGKINDKSIRKEDDFYWLHQNQLQQSALTFYPLVDKKIPMQSTYSEITCQAHTLEKKAMAIEARTQINNPLEKKLLYPISIVSHDITALITSIKTVLNQSIYTSTTKKAKETIATMSPKQILNHQALTIPALLKKHQLFLSDKTAELTLNTSDLSQQQANELQRIIKDWLINKGYVLKQLIINGVKQ